MSHTWFAPEGRIGVTAIGFVTFLFYRKKEMPAPGIAHSQIWFVWQKRGELPAFLGSIAKAMLLKAR